jgi:hypothetical protein
MTDGRHYDPTWRALLRPAQSAHFFPNGRPADEGALCAELSRLAYVGFESDSQCERHVATILEAIGFDHVRFLSAGGTECFIATDRAAPLTVVAFRGTAGLRDVVTDLMAWPKRWAPGGTVHAGFAGALGKVWPRIVPLLGRHDGRMVYTGHSLGAALATLAASLIPPAALYTFGSPRVGNSAFAAALANVDCRRHTGCSDLVCQVPPPWLGYVHVGAERYLDRNGSTHASPDRALSDADRSIARREYLRHYGWRWGNAWSRRLSDHAPVNYVSAHVRTPPA